MTDDIPNDHFPEPATPGRSVGSGRFKELLRPNEIPETARSALKDLREAIDAELREEFVNKGWRESRNPKTVRQIVDRLTPLLERAQVLLVWLGTQYPMPGRSGWPQAGASALISGSATAAEQALLFSSTGSAVAGAVAGVVFAECAEVYFAASARTRKYRRAQRDPGSDTIVLDLAEALGGSNFGELGTERHAVQEAFQWLFQRLVERSQSFMWEIAVPAFGIGWSAVSSMRTVRRVVSLEMRPATDDELTRMKAARSAPRPQPRLEGDLVGWLRGNQNQPSVLKQIQGSTHDTTPIKAKGSPDTGEEDPQA